MELKNSKHADAIANLYRAALYLGRGSKDVGLQFFQKAKIMLGNTIKLNLNNLEEAADTKISAEKVLDEYKRLKKEMS